MVADRAGSGEARTRIGGVEIGGEPRQRALDTGELDADAPARPATVVPASPANISFEIDVGDEKRQRALEPTNRFAS